MLSQYPWKKDNSFGNTYSNIFGKIENIEIAHIYLMAGRPDKEKVVTRYYQIPENEVFKTCAKPWKKNAGVGHVYMLNDNDYDKDKAVPQTKVEKGFYGKLLGFGKRHHWSLMFLARELAWKMGKINYPDLMKFVDDFQPDIFFLPFSNLYFTNRLALYIKQHYDMPMVMYMAMDHYSLKRVSFNPVFWLDRFAKRRMIRKMSNYSEVIFAISKKLKFELEKGLDVRCEILYKRPDSNRKQSVYKPNDRKLKFLFTGNILSNRWKSLSLLVNALKKYEIGTLDIYTANPISRRINKALNIDGISIIHKPVSQNEVIKLQNAADVLVHAEGFDLYNKSLVRCAISTKIMDYLSVGRCILAIGPRDISSIEYLKEHDLALVACSRQELEIIVSDMVNNREIISSYSHKGSDYATSYLNEETLNSDFYVFLNTIVQNYNK